MLKKLAILGMLLLLAGAAALQWVLSQRRDEQQKTASYRHKYASEPDEYLKRYNEWLRSPPQERGELSGVLDKPSEGKTKAQLLQEQRERLEADLDKLAAGEVIPKPLADILYGANWQDEVDRYKDREEQKELTLTSAIVCASVGGTVFASCTLVWMFRLMMRTASCMRARRAEARRCRTQTKNANSSDACAQEHEQEQQSQTNSGDQAGSRSNVLANVGWHNFEPEVVGSNKRARKKALSMRRSSAGSNSPTDEQIAVLLSDEESAEFSGEEVQTTDSSDSDRAGSTSRRGRRLLRLAGSDQATQKSQESFETRTRHLEEQIAEFKEMTQNVQQTTLEQSEPLNNTLKELTEQISAIRDYASCQQDRVEKLQDGYDWNIVRTFCLRIIRCVDNLERRIGQLGEEDVEATDLEEVRDELLFALESSGVEQFRPEVDSDYRGQEKYAEAAKDRQPCDDPGKAGRIAKVIRPGYQYFIDEENVKVVRTAQVELYA